MPEQPNIPLSEEFTEIVWTDYSTFDAVTKEHLPFQKHIDIRPFTDTGIHAGGGDFLAPEHWKLPNEESSVGPQSAFGHFPALKLHCPIGVTTATSNTPEHLVDTLEEFTNDDLLVFTLPEFPKEHLNLEHSYIKFVFVNAKGEEEEGGAFLNASETALIEGTCVFTLRLGPMFTIKQEEKGIIKIREVKISFEATSICTVYVAGLRIIKAAGENKAIQPGWVQSSIDFDNWNGRLVKPVPLGAATKAPAYEQSILWRTAPLTGPIDPQPIDSEFGIVINTGNLEGTNSFSMYFRQQSLLFTTMLDLVGVEMHQLDGHPVPDLGERQFLPRTMEELDEKEQEELDEFDMEELERRSVPNPVLDSWVYFTFSWKGNKPAISMGNNSGLGYTFNPITLEKNGHEVPFEAKHNYFVVFTLEGSKARARVYDMFQANEDGGLEEVNAGEYLPTEKYFAIEQEPLYDTTVINDDDVFRRRKGRLGFSASFQDNDVFVRSYRPRGVTFAEYKSAPFLSHTPVAGAQLFVNSSETSLWQGNLTLFPSDPAHQHAIESIDKSRTTIKNGFSYKITNKGVPSIGEYQGLQTEFMNFTDPEQTEITFNLWFTGPAREKERIETIYRGFYPGRHSYPGPKRYPGKKFIAVSEPTFASIIARLVSTDGTVIPLMMPELETNQWQFISLRLPNEVIQTGFYQLQILQQTRLATNWWMDGLNVLQRDVAWSARAVDEDPWEGTFAPWTPFENLTDDTLHNSGILLEPRGKELQLRAQARKQSTKFQIPKLVPRYAQLGRLVWPEEEFHGTKPTAHFKVEHEHEETLTFTDESTEGSGPIVTRTWTFGDGTILGGNKRVVKHKYKPGQKFNATLLVFDRYGQTSSYIKEVST